MPDEAMVYEGPTPVRTARTPEALATEILEKLTYSMGKDPIVARKYDWLQATILAVRDRVIDRWMESTRTSWQKGDKRVYYFSMEFLIGRMMRDAFSNMEFVEPIREALKQFNVSLDDLYEVEPDAALGNGGLGRLAACFMESMASVQVPAYGYGIRYVHGMFRQEVSDGWQVEIPEDWLAHGNPWEFERRESAYEVGFGGQVVPITDPDGTVRHDWQPDERVLAVAFDTPIVGWRAERVNTLRLWSAQPIDPLLLDRFNSGDHIGALAESAKAESLTQVLYPADATAAGQELRLRQEYFFCSASLQDIVRRHIQQYNDLSALPDHVSIQLNDTHPAISVVELLRILIDKHRVAWAEAWRIAKAVFSYTNHTLLPEALESWPIGLMERMLPRHVQIIYGINAIVLKEAREQAQLSDEQISHVSLIDEAGGRRVRMGHLAFVGSHSINGVSALHTELMKQTVFADLHKLYPTRINNKTNGITPRRWLMQCNAGLTGLIKDTIGDGFLDHTGELTKLDGFADDAGFQEKFAAVKRANKDRLAHTIQERLGVKVSPDAMFDVQVKRIHEYKRQLLNIIEAVAYYDAIRAHPEKDWVPRVKVFGGKAAPSYWNAKLIIKLINDVARIVNNDPTCSDLLKVVFLPQLQRVAGRGDHAGRRPQRTDLDRRHGSLGHGQYEVRAQRRPDHRYAGWCQYRDEGTCRGRQFRHLRQDLRGSRRGTGRQGEIAARDHRGLTASSSRRSTPLPAACSRPTITTATKIWSVAFMTTTGSWWRATSRPIMARSAMLIRCGATKRHGTARRSATPPIWGGSRPTGPSGNMQRTSGMFPRVRRSVEAWFLAKA